MTLSVGPKVVFLSILCLCITTLFSQKPKSWKYTNLTSCQDPIFLQYQMITSCLNNKCLPCIRLTYKGHYCYVYFVHESFKLYIFCYTCFECWQKTISFSRFCAKSIGCCSSSAAFCWQTWEWDSAAYYASSEVYADWVSS